MTFTAQIEADSGAVVPSSPGASEDLSAFPVVLDVRDLSIEFAMRREALKAVDKASFLLRRGKTLCLVGESGSGKSVTARAMLNIVRPGRITSGEIRLLTGNDDRETLDIARLDTDGPVIRSVRGARIAMIFQEPMSSLSPVHTIGAQIIEAIVLHQDVDQAEARKRAIAALARVQIDRPEQALDRYPFEYSGGMRQRAMIAMALACEPDVLVADEPTTALDVTTQAEILKLIKGLQDRLGMAVLFITHDMGVVAEIADEVAVMRDGKVVETGSVLEIFESPRHPYSRQLVEAARALANVKRTRTRAVSHVAPETPLLDVQGLSLTFHSRSGWFGRDRFTTAALKDVSFNLMPGEALGIVGESGSGKTTLGRCLMGVHCPDAGKAVYRSRDGDPRDLAAARSFADGRIWRDIRMIFQDPYSSLNPRMTVEQIIGEPLRLQDKVRGADLRDRVAGLLDRVGLDAGMMDRYPHAFSGGQRQRIGIARAIAVQPRLIIADEATSALDGSIRAQMLDLLLALRADLGLSFLFIAHDIGVVRYFCDRIAVMHRGEMVEIGTADQICDAPRHPYTQRLLAAVPQPDPRRRTLAPPPAGGTLEPSGALS